MIMRGKEWKLYIDNKLIVQSKDNTMSELTDVELVRFKIARLVQSPKRKRKLNARCDLCRWSHDLQGWLWFPEKFGPMAGLTHQARPAETVTMRQFEFNEE